MHLKHLQKHPKTLEKPLQKHVQHPDKYTYNVCVKHIQHPNKHICNIRLKKQIKHLEQTLATDVYSHCNICNILIYFHNIYIKHLQYTYGTSETLETCACNMSDVTL
jgi:hypothetical protein